MVGATFNILNNMNVSIKTKLVSTKFTLTTIHFRYFEVVSTVAPPVVKLLTLGHKDNISI
jgi:hypothetical protein